jgi:hypothetical protein
MKTQNSFTPKFGFWIFFGVWILGFGASLELLTSEVLLTKEVGSWCLALSTTALP